MEQEQLQETLQKISPIPLRLEISENGNLSVNGDIANDDLQPILDNSFLRYRLYLDHQKTLARENNLTAIYIGLVFSILLGLLTFCLFSPKQQQLQSKGLNYEHHGKFVS